MTIRDLLCAPSVRTLLVGGGGLVVLAAVTLAGEAVPAAEPPAVALEAREPAAMVHEAAAAHEDELAEPEADPLASPQPVGALEDPADFTFAVEIGGTTYIRLTGIEVEADRDEAILVDDVTDNYVTSAIAPISEDPLPEELRPWKGRRVLVGGTCAATVIGFAEIARVSGDPGVVGDGEYRPDARWTVETAFEDGSTMIAAELDRRCDGAWARAADRPAVAHAIAIDDAELTRAAQGAFLASAHADLIAEGWREAKQEGSWRDQVPLDVQVVKHSTTGARWVYVHARKRGGCGDHDVNVAATYQVAASGALTEIEGGDIPGSEIEELVDLNGDGWFERIVGHWDPADRSLVGPTDESALAEIDVPFHGCGC